MSSGGCQRSSSRTSTADCEDSCCCGPEGEAVGGSTSEGGQMCTMSCASAWLALKRDSRDAASSCSATSWPSGRGSSARAQAPGRQQLFAGSGAVAGEQRKVQAPRTHRAAASRRGPDRRNRGASRSLPGRVPHFFCMAAGPTVPDRNWRWTGAGAGKTPQAIPMWRLPLPSAVKALPPACPHHTMRTPKRRQAASTTLCFCQ